MDKYDQAIFDEIFNRMQTEYGKSDEASRKAVIDAHGGVPGMEIFVRQWADYHQINILATVGDLFLAYAAAVDLGVRIGRKLEK